MDVRRGAISARNTVSYLQWLLPALEEDTQQRHHQQQQQRQQGTVVQRGKLIKMAADMGLAQSSNGHQYHWCKALRLRLQSKQKKAPTRRLSRMLVRKRKPMDSLRRRRERSLLLLKKRESEKDDIERRVRALKRLVPGGQSMGLDKLFEETADYIMALQGQVSAMKAIASLFESVDEEKKKTTMLMPREPC